MSKAERTRQFIIEKTAPVFNKKGYAGTSLADLTATTGLTKGAIYGNFQDKDEVAIAAFEYNADMMAQGMRQRIQEAKHYKDKLYTYIDGYIQLFDRMVINGGCPYLNTAVDTDDLHPQLFDHVKKRLQAWVEMVAGIVEEGVQAGEFRKEIEAASFANLFIALIEGSILMGKTLGHSRYFISNMQFLKKQVDTLLKG